MLKTSRSRAFYWMKKFFDPTWHDKGHGGRCYSTFSVEEESLVNQRILLYLKYHPDADLSDVVSFLRRSFSRFVSKSVATRIMKKLGWSWRVPVAFQIQKYRRENIARYLDYVRGVRQIPPSKLKFLDESHIVSKDLHKRKVLGKVNCRTWVEGGHSMEHTAPSLF